MLADSAERNRIQMEIQSSPLKRRLRSSDLSCSENWRKSLRKSIHSSPNRKDGSEIRLIKSPRKWNPKDFGQIKEALHVSTAPSSSMIVCREEEQKKVLDFCKTCIQEDKASSLYVCGCPGTGKTLSLDKVKLNLLHWAKQLENYLF